MAIRFRCHNFYRLNCAGRAKQMLNFLPATAAECRKYLSKPSTGFLLQKSRPEREDRNERNRRKAFLVLGFLTVSSGCYFLGKKKIALAEKAEPFEPGKFIENLPVFTQSEVAKHKTRQNGIWVTYKNGVYDVTNFVQMHPGGNKILLAAGSSLEPYWALYAVHHSEEVYKMLEGLRIGNIEYAGKEMREGLPDLYKNEPERHPALRPTSVTPFNAETPTSLLIDNFNTPNSIFFVRNHLPVPSVDVSEYRLKISGIGVKSGSLTLEDIKKFPKHTISATVQCAGNRRSEMSEKRHVNGLKWGPGAIGNATWSGAKLTDVLKTLGLDLDRADIGHVQFEGLDVGLDNSCYGASIPAEKALDPKGDVLLAYEMNGETLGRDHGFPLRVVAPGIVGARNVKWVHKIVLSDQESPSHWQQNDYKGFSPSTTMETADFKKAAAIQELPVISATCTPENGEEVNASGGGITCKGYAWSGGGRRIVRVDVSVDKGKTWHVADLLQREEKHSRQWSWTVWSIFVPITEKPESVEIWTKAVDSSYNTQPEEVENIWNVRGVINNAYHKIKVKLDYS